MDDNVMKEISISDFISLPYTEKNSFGAEKHVNAKMVQQSNCT